MNIRQFFVLNSLKTRLILSAMLLISIILPLTGFTLSNAFEKHLRTSIDNELSALSYTLLTVAEVDNAQLVMPEQLAQSQFNISESGVYGVITSNEIKQISAQHVEVKSTLWTSSSFLGLLPPHNLRVPLTGNNESYEVVFSGKAHLVHSFSVEFSLVNDQAFPVTLHIIKDKSDFNVAIETFKYQLWFWLLGLLFLLIVVQIIWLVWALKPLKKLSTELVNIEQGLAEGIIGSYPKELLQVTQQLNILLLTEQNQRKRYRNALSDLAHSLKTPIAVIQSQANVTRQTTQQIAIINNIVEHQLTRAQSAGDSAWHLNCDVNETVGKLVSALEKIHQEKEIKLHINITKGCYFKGDEADLMEIIGNITDNAFKAATANIWLEGEMKNNALYITISDDGKGISTADQQTILERGVRADSYEQGHGIGLAIVKDLVESYRGVLTIESLQCQRSMEPISDKFDTKMANSPEGETSDDSHNALNKNIPARNTTFTIYFPVNLLN